MSKNALSSVGFVSDFMMKKTQIYDMINEMENSKKSTRDHQSFSAYTALNNLSTLKSLRNSRFSSHKSPLFKKRSSEFKRTTAPIGSVGWSVG